jgi:hypothetical protein
MTALAAPRDTPQMDNSPITNLMGGAIDTTKTFYPGAMIAFDPATQYYTPAVATSTLVTVGVYQGDLDTIAPGSGITYIPDVRQGVFKLAAGTGADAIPATTPPGTPLYVIDDQTVGLTNGNGTRPLAGKLVQVDSSTSGTPPGNDGVPGVWVEIRATQGSDAATDVPAQVGVSRTVRAAITSSLPAYTAASGVLTANANGAIAAQDGVTLAVNDRVLLTAGASGADNGIYTVTSLGSAGTPWVLTRALDWDTGNVVSGMGIFVTAGTANAKSIYNLTTDSAITVGTTSLTFEKYSTANLPTVAVGAILLGAAASAMVATTQQGQLRHVRGVCTANVADLTAFAVATNTDGLTYVAGDRVLLVAQTTASQNGPYVVGTVTTGTAPLTRPTDFVAGQVVPGGVLFEVNEGTVFAGTTWKVVTAGPITVGTTNFTIYPKAVTVPVTLVAGTATISTIPLLSATKSQVLCSRTTGNTCSATIQYNPVTLTPGIIGTASIVVNAQIDAGTINNADISTLNVTILN